MRIRRLRLALNGLPLLALLVSLEVGNAVLSVVLAGLCLLAASLLLYRNLEVLTGLPDDSPEGGTLRLVGVLCGVLVAAVVAVVALMNGGILALSEEQEANLACGIVFALILVLGNLSPKLPFNRYTGLRLPWTVADEATWVVAHRLLGWCAFPVGICGLITALTARSVQARIAAGMGSLLVWIGIPAALSGIFFWRRFHGK
ncbi:MAG: SdpI family protein [Oscillospiraceae bacterium]|nr:SdpI family protein [Oscillospiraceae bacterium]